MGNENSRDDDGLGNEGSPRVLSAAAKRALAEAEARRADTDADDAGERPRELQGRKGPEPTRYGDWENKGLISDF